VAKRKTPDARVNHRAVASRYLDKASTTEYESVRWGALVAALVHALFDVSDAIRERGRS
jgi:hypothetical protein